MTDNQSNLTNIQLEILEAMYPKDYDLHIISANCYKEIKPYLIGEAGSGKLSNSLPLSTFYSFCRYGTRSEQVVAKLSSILTKNMPGWHIRCVHNGIDWCLEYDFTNLSQSDMNNLP